MTMQTQPQSQPFEDATQMQTQLDSSATEAEEAAAAAGAGNGDGWVAGDMDLLTPAEEAARARKLYEEGPWGAAFDGRSASAAAHVHAA